MLWRRACHVRPTTIQHKTWNRPNLVSISLHFSSLWKGKDIWKTSIHSCYLSGWPISWKFFRWPYTQSRSRRNNFVLSLAKYNFNQCICEISFQLNCVFTKFRLQGSLTIKTFYRKIAYWSLVYQCKLSQMIKPKQVVVHNDFKTASMSEVWIMVKYECGYTFWFFNSSHDTQMGVLRIRTWLWSENRCRKIIFWRKLFCLCLGGSRTTTSENSNTGRNWTVSYPI